MKDISASDLIKVFAITGYFRESKLSADTYSCVRKREEEEKGGSFNIKNLYMHDTRIKISSSFSAMNFFCRRRPRDFNFASAQKN